MAYSKENKNSVVETSIDEFCQGNNIYLVEHNDAKFSREEIVDRAKSRKDENRYDLVFRNCEHFANWCVTGEEVSQQVREVFLGIAKVNPVAAAVIFTGAFLVSDKTVGELVSDVEHMACKAIDEAGDEICKKIEEFGDEVCERFDAVGDTLFEARCFVSDCIDKVDDAIFNVKLLLS